MKTKTENLKLGSPLHGRGAGTAGWVLCILCAFAVNASAVNLNYSAAEINARLQAVPGNTAGLASVSGRVDAVELDVSDLSDRSDALEAQTNLIQSALQSEEDPAWHAGTNAIWVAIDNSIDTNLEARVTSVESDVSDLSDRSDALEAQTNLIQSALQSEEDPDWHAGTNALWVAIDNATVTNVVIQSPNRIELQERITTTNTIDAVLVTNFPVAAGCGIYTNFYPDEQPGTEYYNTNGWRFDGGGSYWYLENDDPEYSWYGAGTTDPWEVTSWTFDGDGDEVPLDASDVVQATQYITTISTNTYNLQTIGNQLATGLSTNFTFMSDGTTTGRLWFFSGIVTNLDLDISD